MSATETDDDVSRCLLLELSHDEQGVIVDGIADPLLPVVAVSFVSTCKQLRAPLFAVNVLNSLYQRYRKAKELCRLLTTVALCTPGPFGPEAQLGMTCAELREATEVIWGPVYPERIATLGMLLRHGLLNLQRLCLDDCLPLPRGNDPAHREADLNVLWAAQTGPSLASPQNGPSTTWSRSWCSTTSKRCCCDASGRTTRCTT